VAKNTGVLGFGVNVACLKSVECQPVKHAFA
jgi:hypothetical protein